MKSPPMPPAGSADESAIADTMLALCKARAPGTICPSEVARALARDWRPLMAPVRAVAAGLAAAGTLAVTQRGAPVKAETARGPIRIGLGERPEDSGSG